MQSIDKASNKKYFKVGEMSIDPKQVFWQMKYCYAMIPIVQYVDGRIEILYFRCTVNNQESRLILLETLSSISF